MPGMGGLALLAQLRTDPLDRAIPVAIVTGEDLFSPPVSDTIRRLGAPVYCKPLTDDDLGPLLDVLLRWRVPSEMDGAAPPRH